MNDSNVTIDLIDQIDLVDFTEKTDTGGRWQSGLGEDNRAGRVHSPSQLT